MSASPSPTHQSSPPEQDSSADEQAFEAFASDQDPLDIEAALWAARRRDGLDAQGQAELQAWLNADPRHAARFNEMEGLFAEIMQAPTADVAPLRAGQPAHAPSQATTSPAAPIRPDPAPRPADASPTREGEARVGPGVARPRPRRAPARGHRDRRPAPRRLAAFAMATAFALVMLSAGWAGWTYWRGLPTFEQAYATGRGQHVSISLPDAEANGTRLHLDTATQALVRLYRDRREVHLKDGQAQFVVAADARRPFHVWAGPVHITVVGTRFSVRHTDTGMAAGQTVISVEEGHVRVQRVNDTAAGPPHRPASTSEPPLDLVAGQRTTVDDQGRFSPVDSLPSAVMAAWRDGRLSFDQTPLEEAIAEFERYGRTGLVVRDPAIAALRVGGSYSLSQAWRFAQTLPSVLPVRLVRHGEVTEVVAR